MTKVLIDANMLLAIIQFKVDVFGQLQKAGHDPVVISCVVEELKKLSMGKGKDARAAKTVLDYLEKRKIGIVPMAGSADAVLLKLAKENDWYVATNDGILIAKLEKSEVGVIRLRQRKLLDLP